MGLERVKIVLVEPRGGLNVGSVARVMKNMGLSQLVLVNPYCDPLGLDARKMAVHGLDVLENAQIFESLASALADCYCVMATAGRVQNSDFCFESPRSTLPDLLLEQGNSALLFGSEDRGLNNQELHYAQRWIEIPANPDYPSLNLAQAVAICAYELYQLQTYSPLRRSATAMPASFAQKEGYYQQLEQTLFSIGYLYPHTAESRMKKFRTLFDRANLNQQEIALLRGILSQMDWAIDPTKRKPQG